MRFAFVQTAVLLIVVVVALAACGSRATEPEGPPPAPIFVGSVMPYRSAEVGNAAVQSECVWNRELPAKLSEDTDGRVIINDVAFRDPAARRLILVAVNVHTLAGAAFTGPKWAVVQGRLVDNGKLVGSFEIGNNSIHGGFTACGTLSSLGENIANDIAQWLKSPTIDPGVSGTSATASIEDMPRTAATAAAVPASSVLSAPPTGSLAKAPLASGQRVALTATRLLRRQPKDTSPLDDSLASGTAVTLDGQIGDFWFVKSGSVAGWLRMDELQ